MTRCLEFYEKWDKEPNFCELAEASARKIDDYLKTVSEFESEGIPRDRTIVHFSEGSSRRFQALKEPMRGYVKTLIIDKINIGEKVLTNDIKNWIAPKKARGEGEGPKQNTPNTPDLANVASPKKEKFDWKGSFPNPGDPSKLKLEIQVHDLGVYSKNWLSNPHLEPLKEVIENLRTQAKKIYGEDKVP